MKSKTHELLEQLAETYGGSVQVMQRLLVYGETALVAWVCQKACKTTDITLTQALEIFSTLTNGEYTVDNVRYAYYKTTRESLASLQRRREYKFLRETLKQTFPFPAFWSDLLPFAYRQAVNVAIELLIERCVPVGEIETELDVSRSRVYKIRKEYLTKHVKLLGDYTDDTELN